MDQTNNNNQRQDDIYARQDRTEKRLNLLIDILHKRGLLTDAQVEELNRM